MFRARTVNCYEVLGICPDADLKDINSAYKRLALKHHPDKARGEDESINEFQKIQQAVEILRDPYRRKKHDVELQYSKRFYVQEENLFPPAYTGWTPCNTTLYTMRNFGNRYTYTYGNSVHMDPYSRESSEEILRSDLERKVNEEARKKSMEDAEKSKETLRREAMFARVMRDEEEMVKIEEDEDDQPEQPAYEPSIDESTDEEEDEHESECYYIEESENEGAEDFDDDESEDEVDDECGLSVHSPVKSYVTEYLTAQQNFDFESDMASDDASENSLDSYKADSIEGSETEYHNSVPFFDCSEVQTTEPSVNGNGDADADDNANGETSSSYETDDEEETADSRVKVDSNQDPITTFLNAKLNHSDGKFTTKDLHAELEGIVMESFCGWLENTRLTFPNAKPLTAGNDPECCPHLGCWVKEYGSPECKVCHRWMPIYTLTCPGCGIKACVGCKFQCDD